MPNISTSDINACAQLAFFLTGKKSADKPRKIDRLDENKDLLRLLNALAFLFTAEEHNPTAFVVANNQFFFARNANIVGSTIYAKDFTHLVQAFYYSPKESRRHLLSSLSSRMIQFCYLRIKARIRKLAEYKPAEPTEENDLVLDIVGKANNVWLLLKPVSRDHLEMKHISAISNLTSICHTLFKKLSCKVMDISTITNPFHRKVAKVAEFPAQFLVVIRCLHMTRALSSDDPRAKLLQTCSITLVPCKSRTEEGMSVERACSLLTPQFTTSELNALVDEVKRETGKAWTFKCAQATTVHCEMVLLDTFREHILHGLIGVSCLSCLMCWAALEKLSTKKCAFHTSGCHWKLWGHWAMPEIAVDHNISERLLAFLKEHMPQDGEEVLENHRGRSSSNSSVHSLIDEVDEDTQLYEEMLAEKD